MALFRKGAILTVLLLAIAGLHACKGKEPPRPAPKPVVKASGLPRGILVYVADGSIWLQPKGERAQRLLSGAIWFPVVSPDTTLVAFWEDFGEVMGLSVLNVTSRAVTKIGQWRTLGPDGRNLNLRNAACWSPQSDRLYFADGRQIWKCDPDGQNLETVYEQREGGCYAVTASPDGSQFAFVHVTESARNLWVYSDRNQTAKGLTDFRASDGAVGAPAWSPQGTKIIYAFYKNDEVNLWTIPTIGGQPAAFTKEGRTNAPWWDPTGKKVVVASGAQNPYTWKAALVNADDGKFIQDLTEGVAIASPSIGGEW